MEKFSGCAAMGGEGIGSGIVFPLFYGDLINFENILDSFKDFLKFL